MSRPSPKEQYVKVPCDCGRAGGQYLAHYELVRCDCGKFFWALQPRRDGPLVAFPWPGYTKREAA